MHILVFSFIICMIFCACNVEFISQCKSQIFDSYSLFTFYATSFFFDGDFDQH